MFYFLFLIIAIPKTEEIIIIVIGKTLSPVCGLTIELFFIALPSIASYMIVGSSSVSVSAILNTAVASPSE
ncbi:MAG: hypothetical protein IKN09_04100 [Clostridia bacterium]|nr:hypothetical protein [Clostridia bacterium]